MLRNQLKYLYQSQKNQNNKTKVESKSKLRLTQPIKINLMQVQIMRTLILNNSWSLKIQRIWVYIKEKRQLIKGWIQPHRHNRLIFKSKTNQILSKQISQNKRMKKLRNKYSNNLKHKMNHLIKPRCNNNQITKSKQIKLSPMNNKKQYLNPSRNNNHNNKSSLRKNNQKFSKNNNKLVNKISHLTLKIYRKCSLHFTRNKTQKLKVNNKKNLVQILNPVQSQNHQALIQAIYLTILLQQ